MEKLWRDMLLSTLLTQSEQRTHHVKINAHLNIDAGGVLFWELESALTFICVL